MSKSNPKRLRDRSRLVGGFFITSHPDSQWVGCIYEVISLEDGDRLRIRYNTGIHRRGLTMTVSRESCGPDPVVPSYIKKSSLKRHFPTALFPDAEFPRSEGFSYD